MISAATRLAASRSTSAKTMRAPSAASVEAIQAPMPRLAPVTIATSPANRMPQSPGGLFGRQLNLNLVLSCLHGHFARLNLVAARKCRMYTEAGNLGLVFLISSVVIFALSSAERA